MERTNDSVRGDWKGDRSHPAAEKQPHIQRKWIMDFQNRLGPFGDFSMGHFQVTGENEMSKDCKPFSVELSAYFDDELEGVELEGMEAHLSECEYCQDGLKKLKKLRNALVTMRKSPIHHRSVLDDLKAKLALESDDDLPEESQLPS